MGVGEDKVKKQGEKNRKGIRKIKLPTNIKLLIHILCSFNLALYFLINSIQIDMFLLVKSGFILCITIRSWKCSIL